MHRLVEIPVASGGSITVEVEDAGAQPNTGRERTMRGGDRGAELIERSTQTLEESAGAIAPALRGLLGELRGVSSELSEIELELGLKLSGEAGMVVARAGAEANFLVRLTWTRAETRAEKESHVDEPRADTEPRVDAESRAETEPRAETRTRAEMKVGDGQ